MAANFYIVFGLLLDFVNWSVRSTKRLGRFLIWQWRAKKRNSAVRSFEVALGAVVGERVIIEKGVFIDAHSSIDNYSYINPNSSLENVVIGKFCSIARDVMIGPASHNYKNVSTHPFWHQAFYGFDCSGAVNPPVVAAKTRIGDDVWIGCNVVVMQGISLNVGAVIGAGSIVTKDVGPYEIWAGAPAKKIGQRFDSDAIQALVALGWCNLTPRQIQAMIVPNITNVKTVLQAKH